ncbi:lipopolysaccharide biosynthesis protein [Pistricoccus aurantiacus]|uniref:Lipopolysaccharide biosynthesis protein n=1 Tax=Pistricoccus aurantiacus TaxID=1883414 RepID=A0A5B8SSC8_9GAMM|nr:Wzz/FepE/Etk N-terminal domain-containing protein [Pistricoccus aurantiacus]QEA39586.1 lipopolysaccharide biosynthesis protein [Pistricoccus aurantiacus]
MNQPSAPYSQHNDEISLVDLAKILVRRWKAMAVIFAVVVIAALIYALLMPRTYSYISLYSVAEQGPDMALESPAAVVAKAQNLYLGPETRELLASTDSEKITLPFETEIKNPTETLLIALASEANEDDAGIVEQLHGNLLARLKEGQQALVERRREALKRQLRDAQESLKVAQQSESPSAAEITTSLMERIANLKNALEELRGGEVSQTAVKSLEPTGTGRKLILVMAIVLAGLLAIMGAFVIQFISLVRKSLNEPF